MDEQGVPLNKHYLFIFQGVGSSPIFHVQINSKEGLLMLTVFLSLFSLFILAGMLGAASLLASRALKPQAIPVKIESNQQQHHRRV